MSTAPRTPIVLLIDIVALGCAILLLIAFLILPWFTVEGFVTTGGRLLIGHHPVFEKYEGLLLLPLIAGVAAALAALWGLAIPRTRRAASVGTVIAGVVGVAYYIIALIRVRGHHEIGDVKGYLAIGFWIALLASIGLIVIGLIAQVIGTRRRGAGS